MDITVLLTMIRDKLQDKYDEMVEPDDEKFPDRWQDWSDADSLFPDVINDLDTVIDEMNELALVRPSANKLRVKPY